MDLRKKKDKHADFSDNRYESKSQRKREALEMNSVARRLIELKPGKLIQVPLDDATRTAVEDARPIKTHIARKRQTQFIAKLLRRVDADPILETLESFDNEAQLLTARQHRCESWRDRLLEAGDNSLSHLMKHRPDADAQQIRQLIRNAQREAATNKPPASARSLFRLLRDMDEIEALPPCG